MKFVSVKPYKQNEATYVNVDLVASLVPNVHNDGRGNVTRTVIIVFVNQESLEILGTAEEFMSWTQ